jgi:hypothetical protein
VTFNRAHVGMMDVKFMHARSYPCANRAGQDLCRSGSVRRCRLTGRFPFVVHKEC